jgi:hypothetical protein
MGWGCIVTDVQSAGEQAAAILDFLSGMLEVSRWFLLYSLKLLWAAARWIFRGFLVLLLIYIFAFSIFDTQRNIAYRYSPPPPDPELPSATVRAPPDEDSHPCVVQHAKADLLDKFKVNNKELDALDNDDELRLSNALSCMLQVHRLHPYADDIPGAVVTPNVGNRLQYYLSFLEFGETGNLADRKEDGTILQYDQLSVLSAHLAGMHSRHKQNFVLVFVHGWRHDASIGDDNVEGVRVFAAYLASFLQQRCVQKGHYCDAVVTAVYVGWRGARVNENGLKRGLRTWLGSIVGLPFILPDLWLHQDRGTFLGTLLAIPTLFDRKPSSERVAPSVLSALQFVDDKLQEWNAGLSWGDQNHMIVIGHSLGGNMLAVALKERVIDEIRRHTPGTVMKPPLGNLVVLINPASEAENWIALQRETRSRANMDTFLDKVEEQNQLTATESLYPINQPPIYISLTAASEWPAGGIRELDKL